MVSDTKTITVEDPDTLLLNSEVDDQSQVFS
jgi:hypothetical protein